MARRVVTAILEVAVVTALGVALAALVAVFRSGSFEDAFTPVLWLIGALMLLLAFLSLSPSTQTAQDSFASLAAGGLFRRGRESVETTVLGMTATLALGAVGVFVVAFLVG